MSQLFVPGRRNTSSAALAKSPLAGSAKAAGLIHCAGPTSPLASGAGLRSSLDNVGLPIRRTRPPSPPPVRTVVSVVLVVFKVIPLGVPLAKAVMPDNCQLSKTAPTPLLFHSLVARGRSYV